MVPPVNAATNEFETIIQYKYVIDNICNIRSMLE